MENQKVTFDQGIEVELDADVAAKIEAARAADEDQLRRVRTAIASMPAGQRRHAWDAYRLVIRATTDADNALSLAAAIRAGDAELEATVRTLIYEINEARLRQDRDWEESPPSTRPH
jgi:lipopolysaccharide export system protein LptC